MNNECISSGLAQYANSVSQPDTSSYTPYNSSVLTSKYPISYRNTTEEKVISESVYQMEQDLKILTEEYQAIRIQIRNIRIILGLHDYSAGEALKLSTAMKEIALEIEKRTDIFGVVNKSIPDTIRV